VPLFFGAGNVVELLDADSIGAQALLAGMAQEVGAAIVFTAEHSDKTRGAIGEMRRATEMMVLTRCRPYPKDLGIDLLVLKEKRRRREPPLAYDSPSRPARRPGRSSTTRAATTGSGSTTERSSRSTRASRSAGAAGRT
jgi:hypothetical protein